MSASGAEADITRTWRYGFGLTLFTFGNVVWLFALAAATMFGVVFIPVLYVVFQSLREWVKADKSVPAPAKAKAAKGKA